MQCYRKIISETNSYINDTRKASDNLVVCYRGQAKDWKLKSKLKRMIDNGEIISKEKMEWDDNFSTFENIARLQHYGKATRLLDYSTDINVALFFACSEYMNEDGILYMCSYMQRNTIDIDVLVMSEIMLLKEETSLVDFKKFFFAKYPEYQNGKFFYDKLGYPDGVYSLEEQYKIGQNEFALLVMSWINHGFMVIPLEEELDKIREWNPRLYSQKGAFFITGNKIKPEGVEAYTRNISRVTILPELVDLPSTITNSRGIRVIRIPAANKRDILQILHEKGITAKTLHLET